eukprot:TRINITY_DN3769_c0_g1_i1.p1 TRINITY_DN3769_c0_g1~~TRINITY_DN3769_c0_g1_i1.p1  ORF type:complete len:775 (-),score=174.06 TRINITY_DN3769_c0_g1_i1:32-2356(-)
MVADSLIEGHPLECCICLERMKDISFLTTQPDAFGNVCNHYFCTSCIQPAISRSANPVCPTCRRSVLAVNRSKVANELLSEIEMEREQRKKAVLEKQELSKEVQTLSDLKHKLELEVKKLKKKQADESQKTLEGIEKYRKACDLQVEEERRDKDAKIATTSRQLADLQAEFERAKHTWDNEKHRMVTERKRSDKAASKIKHVTAELDSVRAELQNSKMELESAKIELESIRTELEAVKNLKDIAQKEVNAKNEALDTLRIRFDIKDEEVATLKKEMDGKAKSARVEVDVKSKEIDALKSRVAESEIQINMVRSELENKNSEVQSLTIDIQKWQSLHNRLQEELSRSRRKLDAMSNTQAVVPSSQHSMNTQIPPSSSGSGSTSSSSLLSWKTLTPTFNKISSPLSYLWSKSGPLVRNATDFQFLERRGSNRFSNVWKAIYKPLGEKSAGKVVAVKKLEKKGGVNNYTGSAPHNEMFREAMLLHKLEHGSVLKLIGIMRDSTIPGVNLTGDFLVIPFMPFDLEYVLSGQTTFKIKTNHVRFVLYQLLSAIFYLHSGEVVHRDIRPTSILLDESYNIKLGSFGSALSSLSLTSIPTSVPIGRYSSPESCLSDSFGSRRTSSEWKAGDMWSVGCVFYEMLKGACLFDARDKSQLLQQICSILECRPSASDVQRNPVLNSYAVPKSGCKYLTDYVDAPSTNSSHSVEISPDATDLLRLMLRFDPMKRITAEEALKHPYFVNSMESNMNEVQLRTCSNALSSELQDDEIPNFLTEMCGGV